MIIDDNLAVSLVRDILLHILVLHSSRTYLCRLSFLLIELLVHALIQTSHLCFCKIFSSSSSNCYHRIENIIDIANLTGIADAVVSIVNRVGLSGKRCANTTTSDLPEIFFGCQIMNLHSRLLLGLVVDETLPK